MTDQPRPLIPYVRQSLARLGETRETSLSLDAQEQIIRDWGEANGFVVQEAIRDHDVRGDDPNRPGLQQIETRAHPGVTIGVYKWDRLARDIPLQETLVRRLQANDVQVVSVTEPSTRLTRVIYGAVNEEFRDALSQRIKGIKRTQASRGTYLGSHAPYGYQRAGTRMIPTPDGNHIERPSGPLVPGPFAAYVEEAYRRAANGEPLFRIVSDFASRNVPTMRGGPWTITTLRRILTNPVYAGDVAYCGEVVARDAHPALIDRETWERANALIGSRIQRQKRHDETSWLEGYVVHACGRRMYLMALQHHRNRTHYTAHFACQSSYQAVKCGEPRRHISRRKLEAAARACLIADLSAIAELEVALGEAATVAMADETAIDRARLLARRQAAEHRFERARQLWLNGVDPLETFLDEQSARDAVLAEIDAALVELPAPPDPAHYARIAESLSTMADVLDALDSEDLVPLIAELGVIRVAGDGIQIQYHPGYRDFIPAPRVEGVG